MKAPWGDTVVHKVRVAMTLVLLAVLGAAFLLVVNATSECPGFHLRAQLTGDWIALEQYLNEHCPQLSIGEIQPALYTDSAFAALYAITLFLALRTSVQLDPLLKPLFDIVWNSVGFPRSLNFDEEGKWVDRR